MRIPRMKCTESHKIREFSPFFPRNLGGRRREVAREKLGLLREALCGATFRVSQAIKAQLDIQE